MHTTHQLLDLAKQRLALRNGLDLPMTDYRLAKLMKVEQATVSSWRTGKTRIDAKFASVFADACELPAEYVVACIEHERAARANDERLQAIYASIADRFKAGCVVAAILAAGMAFSSGRAEALTRDSTRSDASPAMHYTIASMPAKAGTPAGSAGKSLRRR